MVDATDAIVTRRLSFHKAIVNFSKILSKESNLNIFQKANDLIEIKKFFAMRYESR